MVYCKSNDDSIGYIDNVVHVMVTEKHVRKYIDSITVLVHLPEFDL
jgi:hypothetical protein